MGGRGERRESEREGEGKGGEYGAREGEKGAKEGGGIISDRCKIPSHSNQRQFAALHM